MAVRWLASRGISCGPWCLSWIALGSFMRSRLLALMFAASRTAMPSKYPACCPSRQSLALRVSACNTWNRLLSEPPR